MRGEERLKVYPRTESELRAALENLLEEYPEDLTEPGTSQEAFLSPQQVSDVLQDLPDAAGPASALLARVRGDFETTRSKRNGKQPSNPA